MKPVNKLCYQEINFASFVLFYSYPSITFGIVCSIHYCLIKLSFQEWTQQVQEMLNTKKFGDIAFRDKDFKSAIEYYSKVFVSASFISYALNDRFRICLFLVAFIL